MNLNYLKTVQLGRRKQMIRSQNLKSLRTAGAVPAGAHGIRLVGNLAGCAAAETSSTADEAQYLYFLNRKAPVQEDRSHPRKMKKLHTPDDLLVETCWFVRDGKLPRLVR